MNKIEGIIKKIKKLFKYLGPGFITDAADDDPTAIATYTQAGAKFGYGQQLPIKLLCANIVFLAKGEFASDSLLWYNGRNET